jgi:hypothetical protein
MYCSTLFGGPAQVEPADVNGGIHAAIQDGMRPGWYNPGQYSSPQVRKLCVGLTCGSTGLKQNSEAHVRWTGPQIHAQLPKISIFAAAVGTSGKSQRRNYRFSAQPYTIRNDDWYRELPESCQTGHGEPGVSYQIAPRVILTWLY